MGRFKSCFWAVLALTCSTLVLSKSDDQNANLGFGLELILAKLEHLELKIMSLESQNQNLTDLLMRSINSQERCNKYPTEAVAVNEVLLVKDTKVDPVVLIAEEHPDAKEGEIYSSCFEVPGKSGKYLIRPTENSKPFYALCEMQVSGGGWTVVQNRFNGSENFYRNWADYKQGFGSIDGEFWYGLDKMHLLTSTKKHEVLITMMNFKRLGKTAGYNPFEIGSEEEGYVLKELGPYKGYAGDSLEYHKGMKFTTYDRDNDQFPANCAKKYYGAWWYKSCFKSNLNGKYLNQRNDMSNSWNTFSAGNDGLMRSTIMIREV